MLLGIDAQAPFFSCQIQWAQPLFLWYNRLCVWLICTNRLFYYTTTSIHQNLQ